MSSTFFGLEMARRAIYTQQHSLHITGHNIANANTKGFSRQTGVHTSTHPSLSSSLVRDPQVGITGTGVKMDEIRRMRDQFIDRDLRKQYHTMGEWEARKEALQQIEYIYNEPSETGITTALDRFWSSWQELSKNPGGENPTARAVVRQQGEALAEALNTTYQKFLDMEDQVNFTINTKVTEINTLGSQISDLNNQINMAEATGDNANDLKDKRDILIDDLAKIVNIDVHEDQFGMVNINIHGAGLVVGRNSYTLEFDEEDPESNVNWVEQGIELTTRTGELHGLLKIRNETIPHHMNNIIDISSSLIESVNNIHMSGYGLDGSTNTPFFAGIGFDGGVNPPVAEFHNTDQGTISLTTLFDDDLNNVLDDLDTYNFELEDADGNDVTTGPGMITSNDSNITIDDLDALDSGIYTLTITDNNTPPNAWEIKVGVNKTIIPTRDSNLIEINPELLDFNKIAAASGLAGIQGDGTNALEIGRLKHEGIPGLGGSSFDDYIKSTISALGVENQEANRMVDNQDLIVEQLEYQRESVSGVSLDEEMTNMIKFQHAYNSAARMVSTLDELLEVVVSRMGIVGR